MKTIGVNLGATSYPIHIGAGWDDILISECARIKPNKALIVADANTGLLYGGKVQGLLASIGIEARQISIPAGEGAKTLDTVGGLYTAALEFGMDRGSVFIALGGGVTGDLTGFAASTYMRGVKYIQMPTTLLAQVDSSVGGKTGVDFAGVKNIVGSFYQPVSVIINTDTLITLPVRQVLSGLAEVIKYGIIADAGFLDFLEANIQPILSLDSQVLIHAVSRSCSIKAEIVSKDERDHGIRAVLNFGHTVGHAVEALGGMSAYTHGEAVAIGMAAEANMALLLGLIDQRFAERIKELLLRAGLPVRMPDFSNESIISLMRHDKKATGSRLVFALPTGPGQADIYKDLKPEIISRALDMARLA